MHGVGVASGPQILFNYDSGIVVEKTAVTSIMSVSQRSESIRTDDMIACVVFGLDSSYVTYRVWLFFFLGFNLMVV